MSDPRRNPEPNPMRSDTRWRDAKDDPTDPDWWYDWRRVRPDGTELDSFSAMIFADSIVQWRKRSPEAIAKIERERGEKWAKGELDYTMLPVYDPTAFQCRKCGGQEAKIVHQKACSEFNEHDVLLLTCRRCKASHHAKPLDWENPT